MLRDQDNNEIKVGDKITNFKTTLEVVEIHLNHLEAVDGEGNNHTIFDCILDSIWLKV